jgi:hypothetical protein
MPAVSLARPQLAVWLRLGRVSNLPTVWTNVFAAAALAGAGGSVAALITIMAMTLMYIGGMFLNDGFDHRVDAVERPSRPIPSGAVSVQSVLVAGFALLLLAILLLASTAMVAAPPGVMLAVLIVAYNLHHKGNRFGPLLMGACRAMVYLTAGFAITGGVSWTILIAALGVLAHVAGLTYAARAEAFDRVERLWPLLLLAAPFGVPVVMAAMGLELSPAMVVAGAALAFADVLAVQWLRQRLTRPGAVSRAVSVLIAAISLVDGFVASGAVGWAGVAVGIAGFGLTLALQRIVPGT